MKNTAFLLFPIVMNLLIQKQIKKYSKRNMDFVATANMFRAIF